MDILVVKYFLDIVRLESFSEAAFQNNISQSSISKHIIELEYEIGCSLFDRNKRKIRLTPSGAIFYNHAVKLINDYEKMLADIQSNSDTALHTINICLHRRTYMYNIPSAILAYKINHPNLKVEFDTLSSRKIIENLYSGDCDFGILHDSGLDRKRLEIDIVIEDENHGKHLQLNGRSTVPKGGGARLCK